MNRFSAMKRMGSTQKVYQVWAKFSSSTMRRTTWPAGYHAAAAVSRHRAFSHSPARRPSQGPPSGALRRTANAASRARERLFRHANTAQTDSATVTDFHRETRSEATYTPAAHRVVIASAPAVETRRRWQISPPPTISASSSGSCHAAALPGDSFR